MSETSIQALVAHLPANPDTVPVMNPANGKKIYDLPQMSVAQVESAIAAARVAQRDWAKTPVAEHRWRSHYESRFECSLELKK